MLRMQSAQGRTKHACLLGLLLTEALLPVLSVTQLYLRLQRLHMRIPARSRGILRSSVSPPLLL